MLVEIEVTAMRQDSKLGSAAMSFRNTIATSLFAMAALLGSAQAQEASLSDCLPLIGTFLTKNSLPDGAGGTIHSRSLITLTNGGHAIRNDSDQYIGVDRHALSDSRGAWRCDGVQGEEVMMLATMIKAQFTDRMCSWYVSF